MRREKREKNWMEKKKQKTNLFIFIFLSIYSCFPYRFPYHSINIHVSKKWIDFYHGTHSTHSSMVIFRQLNPFFRRFSSPRTLPCHLFMTFKAPRLNFFEKERFFFYFFIQKFRNQNFFSRPFNFPLAVCTLVTVDLVL